MLRLGLVVQLIARFQKRRESTDPKCIVGISYKYVHEEYGSNQMYSSEKIDQLDILLEHE